MVLAAGMVFTSAAKGVEVRPDSQAAPPPVVDSQVEAIREAQQGLQAVKDRIVTLKKQKPKDGEDTERVAEEIKQLAQRAKDLRKNLETNATGLDPSEFDEVAAETTTWSEDLREVVSPAIDELRNLTEDSRKTQELRKNIRSLQARKEQAEKAVANLKGNLEKLGGDSRLKPVLLDYLDRWNVRLTDTDSQLKTAEYQLAQKTENAPSFIDSVSEGIANFFRSRGMNLLIAILIVAVIFFAGRQIHRMIVRYGPMHRKDKVRAFSTRVFDLCWTVGTALFAVIGFLITLYLFDDWVLLSIALIFFFGIIWAGKETLPKVFEQGKLLLNLGSVREGERLVYQGIPWKVGRLAFYTDLTNPALDGAVIRLSVNDLLEMHSRPLQSNEPWFPTDENDWVLVGDIHGKVVKQTPEYVRLVQLGGSRITYPASEFIAASPQNLSHSFRLRVTFGIDYRHQSIATTKVPVVFKQKLTKELLAVMDHDDLISLKVEFMSAGTSSLDYAILADFDGGLASKLRTLERTIQRICVDVCNEQNWVIPFTQITVHQADTSAPAVAEAVLAKPKLP